MRAVSLFLLAFFCWPGVPGFSAPAERLFIRPWIELEPLALIGPGPYPLPVTDAEKALLENARVLFSGMVYGWSFLYIPGDVGRRVAETFTLTPIATIAEGNPRLHVVETEASDTRLWARIAYTMADDEQARRMAWESNVAAMASGEGTAAVAGGAAARAQSLSSAIRDAIRRALDTRYVNKPRQITGDVLLWDDPQVLVRDGVFATDVTVKLMVRELVPYRIY